jgi:hypothetical protein
MRIGQWRDEKSICLGFGCVSKSGAWWSALTQQAKPGDGKSRRLPLGSSLRGSVINNVLSDSDIFQREGCRFGRGTAEEADQEAEVHDFAWVLLTDQGIFSYSRHSGSV